MSGFCGVICDCLVEVHEGEIVLGGGGCVRVEAEGVVEGMVVVFGRERRGKMWWWASCIIGKRGWCVEELGVKATCEVFDHFCEHKGVEGI